MLVVTVTFKDPFKGCLYYCKICIFVISSNTIYCHSRELAPLPIIPGRIREHPPCPLCWWCRAAQPGWRCRAAPPGCCPWRRGFWGRCRPGGSGCLDTAAAHYAHPGYPVSASCPPRSASHSTEKRANTVTDWLIDWKYIQSIKSK